MSSVQMMAALTEMSDQDVVHQLHGHMEAMRVSFDPCDFCGLNHPGGLARCYGKANIVRDPAHIEAMKINAPKRLAHLDACREYDNGKRESADVGRRPVFFNITFLKCNVCTIRRRCCCMKKRAHPFSSGHSSFGHTAYSLTAPLIKKPPRGADSRAAVTT